MRTRLEHRWVILFLTIAVCGCPIPSVGTVLQLSGSVESRFFRPDDTLSFSETQEFRMLTDGRRYLVRIEKPGQSMETDYLEVGFDGTNSYYLNAMPTWVESERRKGSKVGTNIATACVTAIPVPQFEFAGPAGILWCAYVAPAYLARRSAETLYTPFTVGVKDGKDSSPHDFLEFPAKWSLSNDGSLTELVFVATPEVRPATIKTRSFTNSTYRTLQWTNSGSWKIPSLAAAGTFALGQDRIRKAAEYRLVLHSGRLAASAASAGSTGFRPKIPGVTAVTDERFNDAARRDLHFMYFVHSNWASIDAAMQTKGYRDALAVSRPATRARPGALQAILFLLLAAGPAILYWRRHPRHQEAQQAPRA